MDLSQVKLLLNVSDDDVLIYGIAIAVAVIIFTALFFFVIRRKKILKKAVLITGLSESGKTLLFSKLVSSKTVATYTSMKPNLASIVTPSQKTLSLVDLPGNERLRFTFLDEYLPSARGIIFVIDSASFIKEIRDVASVLYTILQECLLRKCRIPFLIVCNKQDEVFAKSSKLIQSQLEKEMNTLRITQTAKLDSTTPNSDTIFLGRKDKDFQFSDLKGFGIEFIECCALKADEGAPQTKFPEMWAWLSKIA